MDIEQIIKRVAEEVYQKIRAEELAGNPIGSIGGGEQWILSRMRPDLRFDAMKNACAEVKTSKAKTLCIPEWFVADAVETLKGSDIQVATIVGLPGGTTSSFAKYAEVKQAIVAGAKVIIIPVNMQLCQMSEWGAAKNDLAESMTLCKGKTEVYALLEVDALSCDQLGTAAEMCASCGVDMVLLSAVLSGGVSDAQVQTVKQKGVKVGVYGGVTASTKAGYEKAGACCFAASSC